MKSTELIQTIRTVIRAPVDKRRPLLIHSAPGVGKSAIVAQAATAENNALYDCRAAIMDPVDVGGLPLIAAGELMGYSRPTSLPPLDCGPCVLFFDEIDKAPMLVQNAMLGIVLDRQIHGHRLSDNVTILAAANRMADRAGSQRLSTALANRFRHINLELDLDSWVTWALDANIRMEVIAFVRFRPELLHRFDPANTEPAFASPRSWEMASNTLDEGHDTNAERELIYGTIGKEAAVEFMSFLQIWRKLPSIDGILLNPESSDVPDDPSTLYAICGGLARKASDQNFDSIAKYVARMPVEFGVFLVKSCAKRAPDVTHTRAFVDWSVKHQSVTI